MHIHMKKEHFDLVVIDLYSTCLRILVDYLDTNVIQYSNYGLVSEYTHLFYPFIPSLTSGSELGAICTTQTPTFPNRLNNVLSAFGSRYLIMYPVIDALQEL